MNLIVVDRRDGPIDRRSPAAVSVGACPLGQGCYCCPNVASHSQQRACPKPHPATERMCSPPYPKNIPACPELPAPPAPPPGFRPLRFEMCFTCGRVTARRWTGSQGQMLAWCSGTFPDFEEVTR